MYSQDFFVQALGSPGQINRGIVAMSNRANFDRMHIAVAYATRAGCKLLTESLRATQRDWQRMRKEWLVAFDYGLTEPRALEYLANLPNSEVRVPNAEDVLNAALRPSRAYHQKLFIFRRRRGPVALAVYSGSANLTMGGLYLNDEQASLLFWREPLIDRERELFERMLLQVEVTERTFQASVVLNRDLLKRYSALWRPEASQETSPIVFQVLTPAPELSLSRGLAIATAKAMWVEIRYVVENRGAGQPGNQIDLRRGTRVFFGFSGRTVARNTVLGSVRLRIGDQITDCHMRFGNNQMDKLNLPIPGNPAPATYENETLLFVRRTDGTYELSVGSADDIEEWKAKSRSQSTLFRMTSGREYGFFS